MSFGFHDSKIDIGQLRLLKLLAKMSNVRPEDIFNELIKNYNELHLDEFLRTSIHDNVSLTSLSVQEIGNLLAKKSDGPDPRRGKYAKLKQIQTIEEGLDALS